MGFEGGCLCGDIRYESASDPLMTVYCHCRNCQKASGGAFSTNVMVPADAFAVTQGEVSRYDDTADSGNVVVREFCGRCGSAIVSRLPDGGMAVVKAGTLDDPSGLQPGMSIWEDSALPWALKAAGLTTFSKNPG